MADPQQQFEDQDAQNDPAAIALGGSITFDVFTARHAAYLDSPESRARTQGGTGRPLAAPGATAERPCVGNNAARTGESGAVIVDGYRIANITLWSLSITSEVLRYVSSGTGGWTSAIPSIMSGRGSFDFKYSNYKFGGYSQYGDRPHSIWPGQYVTLLLVVNMPNPTYDPFPAQGQLTNTKRQFEADDVTYWNAKTCLITEVSMVVDIENAEVVSGSGSFESVEEIEPPGQRYALTSLLSGSNTPYENLPTRHGF